MRLEWDEAKSEETRRRRGFGFEVVERFDFDSAITIVDERRDYGEVRFRSAGLVEGRPFHVAWTRRGEAVRVISVRRMRQEEFDAFGREG